MSQIYIFPVGVVKATRRATTLLREEELDANPLPIHLDSVVVGKNLIYNERHMSLKIKHKELAKSSSGFQN